MARPPGIPGSSPGQALPCGCAGGLRGFSTARPCTGEKLARILRAILRTFLHPPRHRGPGQSSALPASTLRKAKAPRTRGALASGAHDARLLFRGPFGDGETWTIRPRSGRAHGWARLFAWAGARSKSPATAHGLSGHGWTESGAAGCRFLLATSLLDKQKRSSSAADRRTKPL